MKFFLSLVILVFLFVTASHAASSKMGLNDDEIISADALYAKLEAREKILVFDARDRKSYLEAHIKGARLPLGQMYYHEQELFRAGVIQKMPDRALSLKESIAHYSKDQEIVTYCNEDCGASAVLLFDLKRMGFTNVRAMLEGIQKWEEKDYPVVRQNKEKK